MLNVLYSMIAMLAGISVCLIGAAIPIIRLAGMEPARTVPLAARLAVSHHHRDDRPTYFPSRLEWTHSGPQVTPVDWKGSSDLRSTVDANAMVLFPAGERAFAAGESVDVFPW